MTIPVQIEPFPDPSNQTQSHQSAQSALPDLPAPEAHPNRFIKRPATRTAPPTPWQEFLAWPGGSSLLYLASAASLLGGMAMVLTEPAADESAWQARLTMLFTIVAYEIALVVVASVVIRWLEGLADAISLSVLATVFTVGMATPLLLIAHEAPWLCLTLGVALSGLSIALGRWLGAHVLGGWPRSLALSLPVIHAGCCVMPGIIATLHRQETNDLSVPATCWLMGFWIAAIVGVILINHADRLVANRTSAPKPFIRTSLFPWILASVLLVSVAVFQWLLAYTNLLGITWMEVAALPIAALLICERFLFRQCGFAPVFRAIMLGIPAGILGVALIASSGGELREFDDGYGLAWIIHVPVLLMLGGSWLGWCAWRARCWYIGATAIAWTAIGLSTWTIPMGGDWHPLVGGGLLSVALVASALVTRNPWLSVAATAVCFLGTALIPAVRQLLCDWHLPLDLTYTIWFGLLFSMLHLTFGRELPRVVLVIGATVIAFACYLVGSKGGSVQPVILAAILPLVLVLPGLVRDLAAWRSLWPVVLPLGGHLLAAAVANKGWSAVAIAFALLLVGVTHTWRRARLRDPVNGAALPSKETAWL